VGVLQNGGVRDDRSSVVVARIWRARRRILVAFAAVTTSHRYAHGWFGWALGIFAAAGVLLFELRQWWDYVSDGRREIPAPEPTLSGSARFREAGSVSVRLLSLGDRPDVVLRRLRLVTDLDDATIGDLMASVPTTLPSSLSLRSGEHFLDALRDAGAGAQVLIQAALANDPSPPAQEELP